MQSRGQVTDELASGHSSGFVVDAVTLGRLAPDHTRSTVSKQGCYTDGPLFHSTSQWTVGDSKI